MAFVKNPSAEQKKEWARKAKVKEQEAFENIRKIATEYRTDPKVLAEYFSFATRFYRYSQNNVALIYSQNPHASYVQSFNSWKDEGVHVSKGAKALKVLVPTPKIYLLNGEERIPLSDAPDEMKELYKKGQIESVKIMHFKIGSVFDISQTDFPKEQYPQLLSMGYQEKEHRQIVDALTAFSRNELGCPVTLENMNSIHLLGCYIPGKHEIHLNELLEDTGQLSTLAHELGHAMVHHGSPASSTSQKEFEADSIGIMLQSRFGIPLAEERMNHLHNHYNTFYSECCRALQKESLSEEETDKRAMKKIWESFSSIFQTYSTHIDSIDRYVQEGLSGRQWNLSERTVNTLLQNGVDRKELLYFRDNDRFSSIYENPEKKLSLTIPFNPYVIPAEMKLENSYYAADKDVLFATGNRMEFISRVSHNQDAVLLETDKELPGINKSYSAVKKGSGLTDYQERRLKSIVPDVGTRTPVRNRSLQIHAATEL